MGSFILAFLVGFVVPAAVATMVVGYAVKKGNKALGILISVLLGGFAIGLGHYIAYVGYTESEVVGPALVTVRYTSPVVGWVGIVIGGGTVLAGIWRTLATPRREAEVEEAADELEKAIELAPDSADAYYNRGDAYDEMGEHAKAIADYNKAIELDPNHALAYFNRAYAYGEIGEYDKAITDYSKAIELNPSDAQAYYNRGLDYRNKGEVFKAVSDLEKSIELSTDSELTKDAQQELSEIKNSL